ncbi:MAG: thioesterase family protein [Bacteroidota bacterium]
MYRLRFIFVIIKSFLSKKKALNDPFVLNFRVIPFLDTDVILLFTQTYSQYMGLARWNLVFNSEFRTAALKRGWIPVTTKETIKYKKPIKALERVKLTTRLLFWDDRRFYHEHIFYVKGEVRAICFIEGMLRSPKGHLKPNEAFEKLGVKLESPPIPEDLASWINLRFEPHVDL